MYEHHLDGMVELLASTGVVPGEQLMRAKATLKKYWEDKIALVWQAGDVIENAEQQGKDVSKEQAIDILQDILRHHDCQYGVSWNTINDTMDNILQGDGK